MKRLEDALAAVQLAQEGSGKPLAVVLAGHNGSGKSTLWYKRLAPKLEIPLVNADRMMLSILPEPDERRRLADWARKLRDENTSWMRVAQKGVEAFVAQAMGQRVPFAVETVFSHLREKNGKIVESKIDLIREMQAAGYFVLLVFVGLTSVDLSIGRVLSRTAQGGHRVPIDKLRERFPRTQRVMALARDVADASMLVDNSRSEKKAFTPCRVQIESRAEYDVRSTGHVPAPIAGWLDIVSPS